MRTANLNEMIKGWVVGNFDPSLYKTKEVEVAVKRYSANDHESYHYHKIATEITIVISGTIKMNGIEYHENDIVIVQPGEATDFLAVTDAVNAVIKLPGANNDKYLLEE